MDSTLVNVPVEVVAAGVTITWWQLIAYVLPFATAWLKNLTFIPNKLTAVLPLIVGGVVNVIVAINQGADWPTALAVGIGLGATASGTRNAIVKPFKK